MGHSTHLIIFPIDPGGVKDKVDLKENLAENIKRLEQILHCIFFFSETMGILK